MQQNLKYCLLILNSVLINSEYAVTKYICNWVLIYSTERRQLMVLNLSNKYATMNIFIVLLYIEEWQICKAFYCLLWDNKFYSMSSFRDILISQDKKRLTRYFYALQSYSFNDVYHNYKITSDINLNSLAPKIRFQQEAVYKCI